MPDKQQTRTAHRHRRRHLRLHHNDSKHNDDDHETQEQDDGHDSINGRDDKHSLAQTADDGQPKNVPEHWANEQGTAFKNPWPSAQVPTLHEMWSGGSVVGWAKPRHKLESDRRAREIKVVKPDWGEGRGATAISDRGDRFMRTAHDNQGGSRLMMGTWLGHAGAFVEMPWGHDGLKRQQNTFKMLFDPIFSGRAGPTQYTGPARYRPSPCEVADLPGCEALFISHNHYDHLDLSSIQAVIEDYPNCKYFVPLGNKAWFKATGVPEDNVFEMDWWESVELTPQEVGQDLATVSTDDAASASSTTTLSNKSTMKITCVPAQHNSGRTGIDSGSTLWCGWVVEHFIDTKQVDENDQTRTQTTKGQRRTRRGALYFAGDTGYRRHRVSKAVCPAFHTIGEKYGPFDLSFIPIWRGGSLGFVSWLGLRLHHENIPSGLHGSPTDAVAIHLETKSRNSIGVHFGTFIGAENESLEAVIELNEACTEAGIAQLEDELPHDGQSADKGRMGVVDLGETIIVEIEDVVVC
ncbi:hypothetical protein ACM66B_005725 [Microbotryomycetes sp. NB124-2]